MRRFLALLTLILLPTAGCNFDVCNGTGGTLGFHTVVSDEISVEPSKCGTLTSSVGGVFNILAKRDGANIAIRRISVAPVITFDGIRFISSNEELDLSTMRSLELSNESGLEVQILPADGDAVPSDGWLVDPGTTEPFITIAEGVERFIAVSADGETELGECDVELLDGNRVVWDGVELTCVADDPPDPTALIELRNDSPVPNDTVFVVLQGQEPGDLDALNPGDVRLVEYPTGAPLTIEAYAQDLVTLLDDCILNDPSDGDQVIWDGVELVCVDQ